MSTSEGGSHPESTLQEHVNRSKQTRAFKTARVAAICWVASIGGIFGSAAIGERTMAKIFFGAENVAGLVAGYKAAEGFSREPARRPANRTEVGGP